MWYWLKKIFAGGSAGQKKNKKRYEKEKQRIASNEKEDRLSVAKDESTHKEILYYLGEKDPDPEVRKAVASNPSSPYQISSILAQDPNPDVRMAIAERLLNLLPDLEEDKQSQLYAYAVQALGNLALDEVLKIRIALSTALKDYAYTPPKVAGQLARDVERKVAEPILLFCSALSDEDLLEILKSHPDGWAVQAIAQRDIVSEPVSEAVIDNGDKKAGAYLLSNEGALINFGLLEKIVAKAKETREWQKPIATRTNLPPDIASRLAEFADESIKQLLMERDDFNDEMRDEIAKVFRRRMEYANEKESGVENTNQRIVKYRRQGLLNEETISDALAMRDHDLVKNAIATLASIHPNDVQRIIDLKAPKAIISLAWKAKLSMRMALQLQKDLVKVPHKDLIYPKDGTEYPFDAAEMEWQLEFLNLKSGT